MNNSLVASRQSAAAKNEVSLKLFDIRFSRHRALLLSARKKASQLSEKPIAQRLSFFLSFQFSEGGSCANFWQIKEGDEGLRENRIKGKLREGATTQTASLAEYSDNANFKLRLLDSSSSSSRLPHIR